VAKDEPLKTDRQPSDRPPNRSARVEARCLQGACRPADSMPERSNCRTKVLRTFETPTGLGRRTEQNFPIPKTLSPPRIIAATLLQRHRSHNLSGTIVPSSSLLTITAYSERTITQLHFLITLETKSARLPPENEILTGKSALPSS